MKTPQMIGRYWLILLFIPFFECLGIDGATSSVSLPNPTPRPCRCSHVSFSKDLGEGTVKSPGYPDTYCHKAKCEYTIEPHPKLGIILAVESFDIARNDQLTISQYFVENSTEHVIRQAVGRKDHWNIYYGGIVREPGLADVYHASSNVGFRLFFESESEIEQIATGFRISFTRTNDSACPNPVINVGQETVTVKANVPLKWPSSGCVFRLLSPAGIEFSAENIFEVSIEVSNSDMEVYNVEYEARVNISLPLHENDVIIQMRDGYRSFQDTVSFQARQADSNPCVFYSPFALLEGNDSIVVTSPGFPHYVCGPISIEVVLFVSPAPNGTTAAFQLKIDMDDLPTSRLRVDGEYSESFSPPMMERVLTVPGRAISIHYDAMPKGYHRGFNITVTRIEVPDECLCSNMGWSRRMVCPFAISMFPQPNCRHISCQTTVKADDMEHQFDLFYMPTAIDEHITVEDSHSLMKMFRVDSTHDATRRVVKNETVEITYWRQFKRDEQIAKNESIVMILCYLYEGCTCGDKFIRVDEVARTFTSPKYPADYCNELNCVNTFHADDGYRIVLNITSFNTEPFKDVLTVYDGPSPFMKHMQQLSGVYPIPFEIRSSGNNLTLQFITDYDEINDGFNIIYHAEKIKIEQSTESSGSYWTSWLALIFIVGALCGAVFIFKRRAAAHRHMQYISPVYFENDAASLDMVHQ